MSAPGLPIDAILSGLSGLSGRWELSVGLSV
jgi:hypothetical protein